MFFSCGVTGSSLQIYAAGLTTETILVTEKNRRQTAAFLSLTAVNGVFSPIYKQDDLSLTSALEYNFLLLDYKIPEEGSEVFIFLRRTAVQ